jgi:transposase
MNEVAYSVRVVRQGGRYEVHIMLEEAVYGSRGKEIPGSVEKVAGVDLNVDRLAIVIADRAGNFLKRKTYDVDDLEYARSGSRAYRIHQVVKQMYEWLGEEQVEGVVMEGLKFRQDLDTESRSNRFRSNFV